jgi:hypothetical protein
MKFNKKVIAAILSWAMVSPTIAQVLPSVDLLGRVQNNTANQFSNYSFNFTPTTTGANYVGFAFRQDPAYWAFGNVGLVASGSSTNLITNPLFVTGGAIPNGSGLQAPANWGVWYQNNTVPSAAGSWYAPGTGWNGTTTNVNTSTAGSWIDGAVGSFDGIYQGVNLTSGVSYTLSFSALSNNVVDNNSIQLGAYAGACADTTIAATNCTMRSATGFTSLATPAEAANAGGPAQPQVISTTAGTPRLVGQSDPVAGTLVVGALLSTARGTPVTTVTQANARGAQSAQTLTVTQTTTAVTNTPLTFVRATSTPTTITNTYQPTVVDTYDNNTTQTRDSGSTYTTQVAGTPITGTQTTSGIETLTAQSNQDFSTRVDQMAYLDKANQRFNQQLNSNPLDRHEVAGDVLRSRTLNAKTGEDGYVYIIADGQRSNTNSDGYKMNAQRFGLGYEKQVESNWIVGAQVNQISSTLNGNNAGGNLDKQHVGLYSLYTKDDWILKSDLGYASNQYKNYHTLPELQLSNSGSTTGNDKWLSNRLYSPAWEGLRAYAGTRTEVNRVSGFTEAGDAITSIQYGKVDSTRTSGEAGVRYDTKFLDDKMNVTVEAGRSSLDINTAKLTTSFAPEKNILGGVTLAQQRQAGVTNNIAQAFVKVAF